MAEVVLVDNDVVLKTCCYDAVDEVIDCLAGKSRTMHVLGAARFVLRRVISRAKNISNKERAADCLARLVAGVALIEPDDDELLLAAEFEEAAQSCGMSLDGGESQLLAVLIRRSAALLLTGDKRAIRAIDPILQACGLDGRVQRRVACLEQIVMALIGRHGADVLRVRVCSEAAVDISLAICFSCTSGLRSAESIAEGLASYIADIRRAAPHVLVESDDLSTVITQEDRIG